VAFDLESWSPEPRGNHRVGLRPASEGRRRRLGPSHHPGPEPLGRAPVYGLIFLTSYQGGLWVFNEALSNAMEEFRGKALEFHGMLDLDLPSDRETEWIDEIATNVETYLAEHGSFTIGHHMKVYGDTFGLAREKHVRGALKRLCAEGRIRTEVMDKGKLKTDGKGPVEKMRVLPSA
jgi:hypothetical protein